MGFLDLNTGAWGTSGGKAVGAAADPSGGGGGGLSDLDLTHSPVGLWTFTDDSLLDLSGNGNTLVKIAGTTTFVDSQGATWLHFDGSTYFKVSGGETGLNQIGDLTTSCDIAWKMPANTPSNQYLFGRNSLVSSAEQYNANYLMWIQNNVYSSFHEWGSSSNIIESLSGIAVSTNIGMKVHRLSQIRDVSAKKIHWAVDGIRVQTDSYTSDPTGGADAEFFVGAESNGTNPLSQCWLRNIKVIPSALTEAQDLAEYELSHG